MSNKTDYHAKGTTPFLGMMALKKINQPDRGQGGNKRKGILGMTVKDCFIREVTLGSGAENCEAGGHKMLRSTGRREGAKSKRGHENASSECPERDRSRIPKRQTNKALWIFEEVEVALLF